MNHAVRFSESEMLELRAAAKLSNRSIAGQAEHWMRIGRAVERDPAMAYSKIELALRGLQPINLDNLTGAEQLEFLDRLADDELENGMPEMEAFFADQRRRGDGVGLDSAGSIVDQKPDPTA